MPVRGQPLSVSVSNVTVSFQQSAQLDCTLTGYTGNGTVVISITKNSGSLSTASSYNQQGLTGSLTISTSSYSDTGAYTCTASVTGDDNSTLSATFYLTVLGYEAPTGFVGFGLVKSLETPVVECPVAGTPGPIEFYWQRGSEEDAMRVTTLTTVSSGPFVDSMGRLDLTRAMVNDSDIYRCVGIDVLGNTGFQLFNVEITINESIELATQWYFILLYVIAGVVLLSILVLLIWCCYSTRHQWCVKRTKTVRQKQRVRIPRRPRKLPMEDFGGATDEYAN